MLPLEDSTKCRIEVSGRVRFVLPQSRGDIFEQLLVCRWRIGVSVGAKVRRGLNT